MNTLIIFSIFCIIGWISSFGKRSRINKILADRKNPAYWNINGKPIYKESDRISSLQSFYFGLVIGICFSIVIGLVYFGLLFAENIFRDVLNSLYM